MQWQGRAPWRGKGGPGRGWEGLGTERMAWGTKLGGEDERLGAAWGPKLDGEDERLDAGLMRGREEEDDWFEIQIKGIIVYLHFCRLCLKIPQRLIILSRGSTLYLFNELYFTGQFIIRLVVIVDNATTKFLLFGLYSQLFRLLLQVLHFNNFTSFHECNNKDRKKKLLLNYTGKVAIVITLFGINCKLV